MSELPPLPAPDHDDGPPPAAPPGAIVQSAAIGFRVVYLVTLGLAILWLFSNFRFVSADSQAVVMEFGRIVRTQKAGLLAAWPRPIEQVLMLPGPARLLSHQVAGLPAVPGIVQASADASTAALPTTATPFLTGDGNVVMLDAVLNYRITDPTAYVLAQDHVLPALDRMFRATAVQVAAGQSLNDFLVTQTTGVAEAQTIDNRRAHVRDRLLAGMKARLASLEAQGMSLGVDVDRIDFTPLLPPEAKIAFDAVLTAGQKADQAVAAANTAAELRRQGAEREADRLVSAAEAIAQERTSEATVNTASILAIESAPAGARGGLAAQAYREKVGAVLGRAGSVMVVDGSSGKRIMMTGPGRPAAK